MTRLSTLYPGVTLVLAVSLAALGGCTASLPPSRFTSSTGGGPTKPAPPDASLNRIFAAAWEKGGLTKSPTVDDATYLRRVSLDLVGRIPTSSEVRAFLADETPSKRAQLVDRLLASPEHSAHLARVWDAISMGPRTKAQNVDRGAFERWLELRFSEKAPWDRMVSELVSATGKNSLGGPRGPDAFDGGVERAKEERTAGVNAAVNFVLRRAGQPQDLAGDVSRVFLGVQIQCAQCHDHKTEKWKQTDFQSFAAVFTTVKPQPIDREKGTISIFDLENVSKTPKRILKKGGDDLAKIAASPPMALDGTDLSGDEGRRDALAKWMVSPSNPWFARAMVNRVWADLLGAGFVDPVDDFREKNPPVLPEALDRLAADFRESRFDLDALYREICASEPYQRAVAKGDTSAREALFSRAELSPMSSDQLLDSIFAATELDRSIAHVKDDAVGRTKLALRRRMAFVFDDDSESNAQGYDGTVQQALMMMNGTFAGASTSILPDDALESIVRDERSDASRIEELYLRTLSRLPTGDETARWEKFFAAPREFDVRGPPSPDDGRIAGLGKDPLQGKRVRSRAHSAREQAYEDMFWALVNSSEFFFRR